MALDCHCKDQKGAAAAYRSVVPEELEGAVWNKEEQWKKEIRNGDLFLPCFFW